MAWHNKFTTGIFSNLTKTVTVMTLLSAALVTGCGGGKKEDVIVDPQPKAGGCTGSYVGYASPPSQDVRRATRDRALISRGYDISNLSEEQKNALTGGGGLDGGMYLEGSFAFETDVNCNVVAGDFVIFGYPFGISGTVNQDRTFTLSYLGPIVGQVNADNSISGQLQHGGGEEYIHGVLSGTFTPGGKI
jgi:hypothetical protein